ncbi:MAG TPA: hypothetical protein VMR28_03750 [Candidatus Saccharimonadales bacterium]|nr:hypothetical protein [Candidatus Saccharimonadales bacterium]
MRRSGNQSGPKDLPENWGDGPLQSWPPHISEAEQLLEASKRTEAHMRFLDDHPEIPASAEEATEGLILEDIIERSKRQREMEQDQ